MSRISREKVAINKAIHLLDGVTNVAKMMGVTYPCVIGWRKRKLPVKYVIPIEKATKGAVTRYDLRPDLYPED